MLRNIMHLRNISYSCIRYQKLILTSRAVQKLKNIAKEDEFLRIMVDGGGCSGFEYKLSLDTKQNEDDVLIENDGAKVIIDKISLELVQGSTIDYEEKMMRSAFRITDNPLATKGCSCGASFALK
uniref:Iron-sulfur cluster assembly 2 homolog, mitochondrial n=1 Tax=Acrobeloides nanus TaxID=290746 RepID=A0A914C3C9_9BILA